jgi:CubicO group peptidase (beta-lactamase class C family)
MIPDPRGVLDGVVAARIGAAPDWLVGAARAGVPSASLTVRVDGREVLHHTVGLARLEPRRPVMEDQPYDLASVTKALVTSSVTASLIEDGVLSLDQRVRDVLPDVDERVLLRHLLNHTSGYPWWRPLYEHAPAAWGTAKTRRSLLDRARSLPLEAEPGTRHSYSDIGMLVLMQVFEAVGVRVDTRFRELADRAGVADFRWGWPGAAATEVCPVRGILVEGTVHDLNCASLGGVSTHAGLFGTSRAVATYAEALMDAVAAPSSRPGLPGIALGTLWSMPGVGSHRGIWDTPTPGASSTGSAFPADSRGHLGYTGNSVWVVPSRRTVVALLTNRVHPTDDKEPIRAIRPLVHDAVARYLGWEFPA